ncbi:hypothetical protein PPTG_08265 [Phytophthora nicotianae INRA-310]|uniref:DUF6818 domain-containing protein n=1 Tax=Phytophthora nicotianae (strain INRA-310) TaxID=761204 RepID=W2QLN0_PHYN3|nr:hypothetical protein PPTG_08265 [Phytophthora nicotianae INRA-310]ETN13434.1 hypothetical protein PPTG_08265 [Phytophthora nicotianae INRA-310]
MSKRGRRTGYTNYSVQKQMLLCHVIETVKPTGRNMWEQTARLYNSQRSSSWAERDFDSLRRKFKNLYTKPKRSGYNGRLPPKHKPDEGQDDAQLIAEVNAATGGELEHAAGSFGDEELDGSESNEFVGATDDPGDDELPDQAVSTESSSPVTQTSPGEAVPAVLGSIATSNGLVDARFGDLFPSDDDDEDGDEAGDMADGGQGSPQSTEPSTIHAESMMDTPSGGGATTDARRNSGRPSIPKQTRAR